MELRRREFLRLLGAAAVGGQRSMLKRYSGVEGIIEAFRRAPIVALPDRHRDSNSSRFRIDLISRSEFANTVDDIVIEWGNRLYQDALDRYAAGDDVPDVEVRQIWRNTTVLTGMWDSPVYAEFLRAVRDANTRRSRSRRMRVLAADPPIDWTNVRSRTDYERFAVRRDESVLTVIEQQVLSKDRKALLIMGGGHFRRGTATDGQTGVVDLLEIAHPSDRIFVVGITPTLNHELTLYPPESFFFSKGTWLEAVSTAHARIVYDGVLTLEDGEQVPPAPGTYNDPAYFRELDRRWRLIRGEAFDPNRVQ